MLIGGVGFVGRASLFAIIVGALDLSLVRDHAVPVLSAFERSRRSRAFAGGATLRHISAP
jgi:hypothetical protein